MDDTTKRDAEMSVRNNNIDQIKQAEREKEVRDTSNDYVEDFAPKVNQSDVLRKQRKEEAENLIKQRTIDARSIFEQNTAAGQMKKIPEKPARNSILKAQNLLEIEKTNEEPSDEESDQFSTIKRSPRDIEKKTISSPTSPTSPVVEEIHNQMNKQQAVREEQKIEQQITDQQFVDEYLYGLSPGLQARALYDYQAGKAQLKSIKNFEKHVAQSAN